MAEKDYYSFEEVLRNLKLEEDQLKRLVSAGEIRAFRDKDTMRFKAEDVDRLKDGGEDELVLEDGLELDLETPAAPAARVTEEIDLQAGDELVFEEPAAGSQVVEIDLGGGDAEVEVAPAARPARTRVTVTEKPARKAAAARTAVVAEPVVEEATDSVGTMALLLVGCVALIAANFVVLDALTGRASNPISQMVAKLF